MLLPYLNLFFVGGRGAVSPEVEIIPKYKAHLPRGRYVPLAITPIGVLFSLSKASLSFIKEIVAYRVEGIVIVPCVALRWTFDEIVTRFVQREFRD